jgi:hypothetical protein
VAPVMTSLYKSIGLPGTKTQLDSKLDEFKANVVVFLFWSIRHSVSNPVAKVVPKRDRISSFARAGWTKTVSVVKMVKMPVVVLVLDSLLSRPQKPRLVYVLFRLSSAALLLLVSAELFFAGLLHWLSEEAVLFFASLLLDEDVMLPRVAVQQVVP